MLGTSTLCVACVLEIARLTKWCPLGLLSVPRWLSSEKSRWYPRVPQGPSNSFGAHVAAPVAPWPKLDGSSAVPWTRCTSAMRPRHPEAGVWSLPMRCVLQLPTSDSYPCAGYLAVSRSAPFTCAPLTNIFIRSASVACVESNTHMKWFHRTPSGSVKRAADTTSTLDFVPQ